MYCTADPASSRSELRKSSRNHETARPAFNETRSSGFERGDEVREVGRAAGQEKSASSPPQPDLAAGLNGGGVKTRYGDARRCQSYPGCRYLVGNPTLATEGVEPEREREKIRHRCSKQNSWAGCNSSASFACAPTIDVSGNRTIRIPRVEVGRGIYNYCLDESGTTPREFKLPCL